MCGAGTLKTPGGGGAFVCTKGLFCCCCCCWCCCVRLAAVVRSDEEGAVVAIIERAGLDDDELLKSLLVFIEDIVIGRVFLWSFPILEIVRNFAVDERFDPVLVPLTARVAGGFDSTIAAVVVFERLIINWSLLVKRSILMGGKRVFGSVFSIFVLIVVAERYRWVDGVCRIWFWDDCGVVAIVDWDEGGLATAVPINDICCWFRLSIIKDVEVRSVGGGGWGGGNAGGIWDFLGDAGAFVPTPEFGIRIGVTRNKPFNFVPGSGVERSVDDVSCNKALVAVMEDVVGNEKRFCDNERGGKE
jgi:hypothetical protein